MSNFLSPYLMPLAGGLVIGASAVILLLFLGRIAGISNIFWNATRRSNSEPEPSSFAHDRLWRWLFLLGLPLGAWLANAFFSAAPENLPSSDILLTIAAGLLVGFGAKMSNGCTSGHGVCGIGRFSTRGIVATLVFIGSGVLTVLLVNLAGGAQ